MLKRQYVTLVLVARHYEVTAYELIDMIFCYVYGDTALSTTLPVKYCGGRGCQQCLYGWSRDQIGVYMTPRFYHYGGRGCYNCKVREVKNDSHNVLCPVCEIHYASNNTEAFIKRRRIE